MHAHTIVTRVLGPCLSSLHAKRAKALLRATSALVQGALASLSGIALCLSGATCVKHRIKSVDRLLGNAGVEGARRDIYRALAQRRLKGVEHILVVVDWSDLTKDQHWQLLRASVALDGRGVTPYEEVHAQNSCSAMTDFGSIGFHTAQCAALTASYAGRSQVTYPSCENSCSGTGT